MMAEQSLKDKTVKGVAWSGIDNVAQFGVSFVVSIVLARLLSPDDYGLIGIIAIFTAVCNAIVNAGFTTALIQKKDATDKDFDTVFIVNLLLSLFLYAIIYLLAPFIASFFNRVELVDLTRVSSLGIIIGAFAIVQQTILTKRIDFKSQTKITIISSILSGVCGILMALTGFGVWALVAQQLSMQCLRTMLLWIVNRWLPRFYFSWNSFNDLFGFGWKIMVSSLLETVWKELYQVVIGKLYSPASLGQYTRADGFSKLLSSNLTTVIQRVTFPVLSSIQDEPERLKKAFRRIIRITMFITAISMFFLGAVSEPLIFCLIGSKWHEAAVYLPLICISGISYPWQAINLNVIEIQGRGGLYLGLEIVKKVIALGPLAAGVFWGIIPMLYLNIVMCAICFFINSYYSGKFLRYSSFAQIKDVTPSFLIAIIIAVPVYCLKNLPLSYYFILFLQILIGAAIFFMICKITKNEEYKEVKNIVSSYFYKFKSKKNL